MYERVIKTIEKYFNQRNNTEKKNIVSDIIFTTSDSAKLY
jgi:hypothetical protein